MNSYMGYMGGYNQMGYGGYGVGNPQQNNPMEGNSFRSIYGVLGKFID